MLLPKVQKTKESSVEAYLVKAVRQRGGVAIKLSPAYNPGIPDRLCILPGRIFFCEVKQKDGRLSRRQQIFIALLRRLKAEVHVIYSKEKVRDIL